MIDIFMAIDDQQMMAPPGVVFDIVENFSTFSELLDRLNEDQCNRWRRKELYSVEVIPGMIVADILYSPEKSPLDADLRKALGLQIDRCLDLEEIGEGGRTAVEQIEAWKIAGQASACIGLRVCKEVVDSLVVDEGSLLDFYRVISDEMNFTEDDFIEHAERAFPNLIFKDHISNEFRRFREPYASIRPKIIKALSVLNDRLNEICEECANDSKEISKKLSAEIGFKTSLESPKTHKNANAMKERNAIFGKITCCCEWHVKFSKTFDRMHFYFGNPNISGGKTLICHFVEHFST